MKIHSQNLNDSRHNPGSMFWFGRAWLKTDEYKEVAHIEWMFGRRASGAAAYISFGHGENNDGLMLHACVPWLLSVFFTIGGVKFCLQEHRTGFAIHNYGFWLYPFTNEDDRNNSDPWYAKSLCWYFPWKYKHHLTEVLTHASKNVAASVWDDSGKGFMESYSEREAAQRKVSKTYAYDYRLKSGEVQHREATVFVERMTWRARWWPLIPLQKTTTSIDVRFSDEVGEETGSWKGGCIGCSYEMVGYETPLSCLRRMEMERKF